MITDSKDKKCTPKQKAKEVIIERLHEAGIEDGSVDSSQMTEKELALVNEQLGKIKTRLLKVLGAG